MKNEKVIEILQNELQCVKRQIHGCCDNKRDCPNCDLKLEDNKIIVAYAKAIQAVEKFEQEQKINTSLRSELKTAQETITHLLAENMTLATDMLLCRAMLNAYFEDNIELNISETPKTEGECNNEKIY